MTEEDNIELGNHFNEIEDYLKNVAKSPRFKNPQFQVDVFDLLICDIFYRVFTDLKKVLIYYKHPRFGTTKSYDLTQEQVEKFENYFYNY